MKSVNRKIRKGRQDLSEKERFAMEKEWAEFLLRQRMMKWLVALFGLSAVLGLLVGIWVAYVGLGAGTACVATAAIVACIARVLNTLLRSLNVSKTH